jgi:hypothetical protein
MVAATSAASIRNPIAEKTTMNAKQYAGRDGGYFEPSHPASFLK